MQSILAIPSLIRHKGNFQVIQTGIGMMSFQVFNFVAGLLVARGLGPEGQGRYQLIIALTVFTIGLIKLGLDEGVTYLIPKYRVENPAGIAGLVSYSLIVSLVVSFIVGGVLYFGAEFAEAHIFTLPGFANDLRWSVGLFPALMMLFISVAILRGLGRADLRATVYYYGVGLLFPGLLYLFYYMGSSGLTISEAYLARILAYTAGFVLALWFIVRHVPKGQMHLSGSEIRALHRFAGWLVFVGVFQYIIEQPLIDLIILGRIAPPETIGIYSVAARIGALVAVILNAVTIVMGPVFAKTLALGDQERLLTQYQTASIWLARCSICAGICLFLLRYPVIGLFGQEYLTGANFLLVFLLGQMLTALTGINGPLLVAAGYVRAEFCLTMIFVACMVGGGILLGQLYGALGVAVGTAGASLGIGVARYFVSRHYLKIKFPVPVITAVLIGGFSFVIAIFAPPTLPNELGNTIVKVLVFLSLYWGLHLTLPHLSVPRFR